ncbi:hypothetical protein GCM10007390_00340 [Persicitalea jodogahamensis]|uniref:Uncharacterized protein n=2 Tax=Persicitalea jodogahamensis TaxID=402147 RepID=A0A8J3CZ81_9BACT|nr:hypothetical protein GCM10007390_00340 [Persicitalea jodogahamensis]
MADADAWAFIKNQSHNILDPAGLDHYVRRENMIMRWTLPLLFYITRSAVLILLIQGLLGCGFLYLFLREVFRSTGDRVLTVLMGLGLSNMFIFSWFFVDTIGYGDGFAYFFLMLALVSRKSLPIFIFLQIAFFTDERALIGAGCVILWWTTKEALPNQHKDHTFGNFLKKAFTPRTWVVIAGVGVYFAFRSYIMDTYFPHHTYSTVGEPVMFADAHRQGLGGSLWFAFEGMWLILGIAGFVLYRTGRFWLLAALTVAFVMLLITGIFVHDINRDYGYGFPLLLIANLILARCIPPAEYRKLVFVSAFFCIVSPMCYTMGYNKVIWAEPLPVKAMMALDRIKGWGTFD